MPTQTKAKVSKNKDGLSLVEVDLDKIIGNENQLLAAIKLTKANAKVVEILQKDTASTMGAFIMAYGPFFEAMLHKCNDVQTPFELRVKAKLKHPITGKVVKDMVFTFNMVGESLADVDVDKRMEELKEMKEKLNEEMD